MLKVDIIECKTKCTSSDYPFATVIASESITARNISIFKELNINQLGLVKDDSCFDEIFYILWGDLKTEVQIISMQNYRLKMDCPYDCYKHIFSGHHLWHLRFNYLKIV